MNRSIWFLINERSDPEEFEQTSNEEDREEKQRIRKEDWWTNETYGKFVKAFKRDKQT